MTEGRQLGQTERVVAVGLALGVLELPGLTRGVGDAARDAEFAAEVVDPAGRRAGFDDDDRGAVVFDEAAELVAAGADGAELNLAGVRLVAAGDGLVLAQVQRENGAGGRDGRGGGRRLHGCKLRGWWATGVVW